MKALNDIIKRLEKTKKISLEKVVDRVLLANRKFIESVNKERLEETGTDMFGKAIKPLYTPYTKDIKRSKGQRIDHVTLKDTGDFYKSFKFRVSQAGYYVEAEGQKDADTNLLTEYGDTIIGVDRYALELLRPKILKAARAAYYKVLLG